MKNITFFHYFLFLFFAGYIGSMNAQKFEGTLTYNIHYIPKSKQVKIKDLEIQYGNKEIVNIKNGNYRSERQYNDQILKTTIYDNALHVNYLKPNQSGYWIKSKAGSDFAKRIIKLDTSATIGNYSCDVFRYTKTALTITFYISKEKYAEKDNSSSWYTYPTSFNGPLIKLVAEAQDYIMIQELAATDAKTIDIKVFETANDMVVVPMEDITNKILPPAKRQELLQCMYKSIGYPGFLQLNKIEGKINVELLIDNTGAIKNTSVRTEYFKKQEEIIRIYNLQKVKNLERKTQNKVLPLVKQCLAGYTFESPVLGKVTVNTVFRIPFVFSKNAADIAEDNLDFNEQDIDESFYDEFDEFY
jgi:hypothetical protein